MDPYWFFPVEFLSWDSLCGSGAGVEREEGKSSPVLTSTLMGSIGTNLEEASGM